MYSLRSFVLLSFIQFFFIAENTSAQDTSIIKYLPLNVGNVWVYNFIGVNPPSGKTRLKITGTLISNGHLYYLFTQTGLICSCSFTVPSPFLIPIVPMRIDSLTGNVMLDSGSCAWYPNEKILDTLKIKIGDSPNLCSYTTCFDTNTLNIFGVNRKTKYFGLGIMTYYSFRRYVKDIGLYYSIQGCYLNTHCTYTLQGCVINGIVYGDTSFPVGINQISAEIPESFSLYQNYPNPFNPASKIRFSIPFIEGAGGRNALLTIYDILGREVETIVNEKLSPGTYEVNFDGSNLSSGVYYYTLSLGNYTETKKMVLIK